MVKEKLWTKNFILVSIINFFLQLVFYLLLVTIGTYAVEQFHVSTSIAGLVTGIYILGALMGRLGTGRLISSIGSKKILLVGLAFFMIATAFYFGAINISLLLIVRLIHGIAVGIAMTAAGTIIAQVIPVSRRGEGISYFSMSAILATAVGPFLGITLMQHASFYMIFILCLLLGAINLSIAFMVPAPMISSSNKKQATKAKVFELSNFFEYSSIPISIVMLIVGLAYSGVLSFLTFYAKEINLVEAASFYFLVYAVMVIISRPFSGRLMDIRGANIVAYPALVLFAIGMLLLSQAHLGLTLLLAGVFISLGYGNFFSIAQTISIKYSQPHRLGLATSTFFIFLDLGLGLGPYFLGLFVPLIGYRNLYLTMVVVILASIILYHFLQGRNEDSQRFPSTSWTSKT